MIVTRGLGYRGILVTAGLAMTLGVIVIPPAVPIPLQSINVTEGRKRKQIVAEIAATITIPPVTGRGLLAEIEASGSAYVTLYMPTHSHEVGTFKPSGSATASIIGIRADTQLGQILATGEHDIEDSELLAMVLALLNT